MQRIPTPSLLLLICFVLSACHSPSDHSHSGSDAAGNKSPSAIKAIHIPEFRQEVKKEAVAEYKEKTSDRLNKDWYFSVRLYETSKTFNYLVKMQYEELEGEDTLRLPDLGTPPRPVIHKSTDTTGKYSCIIGFLDNDNAFREYKLVYVKGAELGIRALKHYSVTQGYRLESQDSR